MPCAHDQIELTTQPNNYRLIMAASTGTGWKSSTSRFTAFCHGHRQIIFPQRYRLRLIADGSCRLWCGFCHEAFGQRVTGRLCRPPGRKAAMLVTIMLMGIGTALIAFAPTHEQIGWLAPVLIVIGRLYRGLPPGRSGQRPRCCWSPPAPISADSLLAGSLSAKGLPPCLALH